MKKNTIYTTGVGLVGLLIGVLLPGTFHETGVPTDSRPSTTTAPHRDRMVSADKERKANHRLARTERSSTQEPSWESEVGETFVRVPLSLIRELGASTGERIVGDRLFNDSSAERSFGLGAEEKTQLQAAWAIARQSMKSSEVSSMTSTESADGTVTMVLPSLPSGYRLVGVRFRREVLKVMGAERGESFLALKQVDSLFQPHDGEQTIEVKTESTGDGAWRFHMTSHGPQGRKVWVSDTVPEEISHLTDAAGILRTLSH